MKKKLIYLVLLMGLFIVLPVKAANFSTSISGVSNIALNQQFTVTFNVVNGTNIMGVDGLLNYDSSKLTLVSSSGLNGFTVVTGSRLVAYKTTGKSGTFGFATFTFKAKSTFTAGQSTTISLSDVKGSNGSDISGSSSVKTIKVVSSNNNLSSLKIDGTTISGFSPTKTSYSITVPNNKNSVAISAVAESSSSNIIGTGNKNLNVYANTYNIVVTAENGSKKTYTITIYRKDADGLTSPKSTDSTLKNLKVTNYDIKFNSSTTKYDLKVDNNITNLKVEALSNSDKAKVTIDNPSELKVGINIIKITVQAEDNSVTEYVINVTRSGEGPTTTLDKLIDIVKTTTANTINVDIKDNNTEISSDMLNEIKNSQKQVIINHYNSSDNITYIWKINGTKLINDKTINTNINFTSPNVEAINELTNYSNYLILNFDHSGDLPENTTVTIYVGDKYKDGDVLKLYYYSSEDNKIELNRDNLKVENGYVEFELEHCSEYLLSMANFTRANIESNTTILLLQIILVIETIFIAYLLIKKKITG
jgi:hypothetical protein